METQEPRRRWFRFRLRTLLILVTLVSVPLGWVGWELDQRRREKVVVAWVEEMGGVVNFHPTLFHKDQRNWWEKTKGRFFGKKAYYVLFVSTKVSDLSPLAELKNLKSLQLNDIQVSDFSPLAELKNLELLDLSGTQVSDLSPLAELKNLKRLGLIGTQLSNLSPLAELKNLNFLELSDTQVIDLSPLADLKNLETLYLYDTEVSDAQVQELSLALPNCKIEF